MSERQTKTITTPIEKVEIIINAFMNGGEMMDLEGVAVGAGIKSVDRTGEITMKAEESYKKRLRKLSDIMIVSINGKTEIEERWNALRNLRGQDYKFVMDSVEAAAAGLGSEEGKV
jgi:hypothetical protein